MTDTTKEKQKRPRRKKPAPNGAANGAGEKNAPAPSQSSPQGSSTGSPETEKEARALLRGALSAAQGDARNSYPNALAFLQDKPIELVREALRYAGPVEWRSAVLGGFLAGLSEEHAKTFLATAAGFWSLGYVLGVGDGGNALIQQLADIAEKKGDKVLADAIKSKAEALRAKG